LQVVHGQLAGRLAQFGGQELLLLLLLQWCTTETGGQIVERRLEVSQRVLIGLAQFNWAPEELFACVCVERFRERLGERLGVELV